MQVPEISRSIEILKKRGFGIVLDDSSSQAKVALFAPAKDIKTELLNQMLNISGSQVFVTIGTARKHAFQLGPMQRLGNFRNSSVTSRSTLCESVEAREGIHTGISVSDRTATIRILASDDPNPRRLVKPGHIFPLEVLAGGVLVKPTLFEAAADATTLAFQSEVAVVIDLLGSDGNYLSPTALQQLVSKLDLPVIHLSALVVYRLRTEQLIENVAEAKLPVRSGTIFKVISYRSKLDGVEHVALSLGQDFENGSVLTRVHRERLLSDIFDEESSTLSKSIAAIEQEGRGLIVYLRSDHPESFLNVNTPLGRDALFREYGIGAQIIKQSGAKRLELLSSSAAIPAGLDNFGLEISAVRQL